MNPKELPKEVQQYFDNIQKRKDQVEVDILKWTYKAHKAKKHQSTKDEKLKKNIENLKSEISEQKEVNDIQTIAGLKFQIAKSGELSLDKLIKEKNKLTRDLNNFKPHENHAESLSLAKEIRKLQENIQENEEKLTNLDDEVKIIRFSPLNRILLPGRFPKNPPK